MIEAGEFSHVIRELDLDFTFAEIKKLFKAADVDRNGKLNFSEFSKMLTMYNELEETEPDEENMTEEEIKLLFKEFDKDGSGFISILELRRGMIAKGDRLTDKELFEIIKEADTDGDGKVNYEELLKFLK